MNITPIRLAPIVALSIFSSLGGATTIRDASFEQTARNAELIVIGTVVDRQPIITGKDIFEPREQLATDAPRVEKPASRDQRRKDPEKPASVGKVEGGTMIFTEITIEVDTDVLGSAPEYVTFVQAGGDDGFNKVTVFGLPEFEIDRRYMVFLRPGYEQVADPVVGVNKGWFAVSKDADSGEPVLRDADGATVAGVRDGQLVLNRPQGVQRRQLAPAPKAEGNHRGLARTSPAVQAYWQREHAPASIDDFINDVLDAREGK